MSFLGHIFCDIKFSQKVGVKNRVWCPIFACVVCSNIRRTNSHKICQPDNFVCPRAHKIVQKICLFYVPYRTCAKFTTQNRVQACTSADFSTIGTKLVISYIFPLPSIPTFFASFLSIFWCIFSHPFLDLRIFYPLKSALIPCVYWLF